ncbi:MAG: hypothetical protein IJM79_06440 [Erysipelotrichaceae bacterium]|nr:hypothetical protein [Erysipelotrichaceae bacterium]
MAEKMNDVKLLNYNALMVLQCLREYSDQYRHLGVREIEALIKGRYGYGPTHNTINKILHYLPDYGYDVKKGTRSNPGFYLNSRYFTNGEILYLIEYLKNDKHLSKDDRIAFVRKLSSYLGPEFVELNERSYLKKGKKDKSETEKIAIIDEAIKKGSVLYFDYCPDSKTGEKIRVDSSPYRIFEKKHRMYLLYGWQQNDDFYLLQVKISEISNLYVDPVYKSRPMYMARNYQYIDDSLLARVETSNPSRRYNYHLLVELPDEQQIEKNSFHMLKGRPASGRQCLKTLEAHFGENNVIAFEGRQKTYALIRDIYGDGADYMFAHYQLGKIIWPQAQAKLAKIKIAKLHNLYQPEEEPLDDNLFISIRDSEGELIGNEEDWFEKLKAEKPEEEIAAQQLIERLGQAIDQQEFRLLRGFDALTYVKALYAQYAETGEFRFEEEYDRETDEEGWQHHTVAAEVKLNWNGKDAEKLGREVARLLKSLEIISRRKSPDDLSAAERKVWDAYIRDYQSDDHSAEAARRIRGNGPACLFALWRARRVCKLYELNSPRYLTENEERMLARDLVVSRFAESYRPIS